MILEEVTKSITTFLLEDTIQTKDNDYLVCDVNLGRLLVRREDLLILKKELENAKTTINNCKFYFHIVFID